MKKLLLFAASFSLLAAACAPAGPVAPPRFDTGVDPDSWVTIPAGKFLMGPHDHKTMIDYSFEIMTTPVTNAQYARYLDAALLSGTINMDDGRITGFYPGDPFHGGRHEKEIPAGHWLHMDLSDPDVRILYNGNAFSVKPGYENHPVTAVTWFGALAYCNFYGGNLPGNAEWEKAARGTDGRPFPWGEGISPGNANYYNSKDPFEAGIGKLGNTTPVGFYNGNVYDGFQTVDSPSPYGAYDMAGNVGEWTGELIEGIHDRYIRGGSKMDYAYDLRVFSRNSARPDYYSPNVGFRMMRLSP